MINVNKFLPQHFSIAISEPFRELNHYVRKATLPFVTNGDIKYWTNNNSMIPLPGNVHEKGDFLISFRIDEYFRSYGILYEWMRSIKHNIEPQWDIWQRAEIRVSILDRHQKTEVAEFVALQAFPFSLPEIVLDHGTNDSDEVLIEVPFKCEGWDFNLKQELDLINYYKHQE